MKLSGLIPAVLLGGLALCSPCFAQADEGSAELAVSGPRGSEYRLLRAEAVDGNRMGAFLITREGGSATLMNIMFACSAGSYAYLAMDHAPSVPVSDEAMNTLSRQSRNILRTGLQSVPLTPITDDPEDGPLKVFQSLLCFQPGN